MSHPHPDTAAAIAERNRILTAMDIDAAKRFIAEHGGHVPTQNIDWERVLHLARLECVRLPEQLRTESQIYLAQTGAQSVVTFPANSPYLLAAMDLIFPADTWAREAGL